LATIQARLLERLWTLLKPGGRLLYCTCSVFKAEGDQQMAAFLVNHNRAKILASPGHLLPHGDQSTEMPADNPCGDHDGFYYALLEKAAA
jgi:16S rRNA (cytosine967-C5)-methyltransferase